MRWGSMGRHGTAWMNKSLFSETQGLSVRRKQQIPTDARRHRDGAAAEFASGLDAASTPDDYGGRPMISFCSCYVSSCAGKTGMQPECAAGMQGESVRGEAARRPVSRVLCSAGRADDGHSSGAPVTGRLARPTRTAARKHRLPASAPQRPRPPACRPYLVLLPVGFTVPFPLPGPRCALTAPFQPCRQIGNRIPAGGLLSVALSLGSPPPGVTRHRVSVEPGLSSPAAGESRQAKAAIRPSGPLMVGPPSAFARASAFLPGGPAAEDRPASQGGSRRIRAAPNAPAPARRAAAGTTR